MTEFMDQETGKHLSWEHAWNLFHPLSELGQSFRAELRPYLPSERTNWREDRDCLERLATALQDAEWSDRLQKAIGALRSVETILRQAEAGAALAPGDLFKWKHWMWKGRELEGILREGGVTPLFSWWPAVDWDNALRILNPHAEWSPGFSLDDAYDPVLKEIRARKRKLQHQIDQIRKEQLEELSVRYGSLPNREREYVWLRNDRATIDKARADQDLVLQGETSWDVIFRVQDRPKVIPLLEELHIATELEADREKALLARLTRQLAIHIDTFRKCEAAWGRLDWLLTRILTANRLGWTFPEWTEDRWEAVNAVHPLLDESLRRNGSRMTPISFWLQQGVSVLTGPNMGGKTVALRTAGLLQALAQFGLPVPAAKYYFQPVERIRFVGGDPQSMESGLSAFGGEIVRLRTIFGMESKDQPVPTGTTLLLLDEIGRATNPSEGEALAVGLVRYLQGSTWIVLFASHYSGVAEVALQEGLLRWRIAGLSDHRILPAETAHIDSEAFQIAEKLGLPAEILSFAKQWLEPICTSGTKGRSP